MVPCTALAALKAGTTPDLMAPCLDVYAAAADQQKDQAPALLAEMFTAAQLAQGGITSQQIAQASATLAENARNPKVGEAIRQQRDLKGKLDTLLSQRDDLTQGQRQGAPRNPEIVAQAAALDKQIDDTRAKMADADAALQAASPNYGQLVQQVVTAQDVFAALHPGEAFAAISPGGPGWLGVPAARQHHHGVEGRGGPARGRRAGEADPRGHRADHSRRCRRSTSPTRCSSTQLTLGGVAKQLEGAKALVVAPSRSRCCRCRSRSC